MMFQKTPKNPEVDLGKTVKGIGNVFKIIVIAVIVVMIVGGSFYTIQEEEQAVVCTLGSPKAVTTPGLHFKIPIVQTVEKVNTTIKGF